jgi:uncharacterized membrane protein YbhN (UPF0104 family)
VADDFAIPEVKQGRNPKDLVRYIVGACVGAVVLLLLLSKRGELPSAWHQVTHDDGGWVLAAILAQAASLLTFSLLQHRVLTLSGARIPIPALAALTLANDAIANTIPGEPVISSAYRYHYYRRRGVTPASAGCDFCCLLCAFGAVHAAVPQSGVLLAYGAAQVVGSLPIVPGGIGIIEGSLAVVLMQCGAGRVPALSATLVYRIVSFWLVIAIGWITVGVLARRRPRSTAA